VAATLVKKVMLKIASDDGDTEEKLDRIGEKADELARKHPDLKVRIDTAAASAKLAVLRKELKDTGNASADAKGRFGAFGQALNALTLGVSGGVGQMTMFQKVMAGLGVATGLGEPLVAGLTVAVGGLSSGLVAAGLGAGVFGVATMGAFKIVDAANTAGKKLTGSLGEMQRGLKSATSEWNQWVKAAAPGVAGVVAQGLGLIPKALSMMTPFLKPTEAALHSIITMVSTGLDSSGFKSFTGMMAKESGPMLKDLGVAIINIVKGLGGILRAFMPVAHEMMGGLDSITAKFAHWGETLTSHSGFQSLMAMFKSQTPLAVSALKQLAGIIKTVVSQMTSMSTVSNSKMLLQLAVPVLKFADALLKAHPGLVNLILYMKLAADAGGKLKPVFQGISGGLKVIKGGASAFQDLSAGFSNSAAAASSATGAWGTFGGKMSGLVSSVGSFVSAAVSGFRKAAVATAVWIGEHAVAAGTFIAENVAMAASATAAFIAENAATLGLVAGIAALVAGIVYMATHWKQTWNAIKTVAVDAWHFIDNEMIKPLTRGIGDVVDFITSHWKILAVVLGTMLLGPIAGLVIFVATHWDQVRSFTSRLVDDVTGFFERLPGRIMSAISALPGMLYNAGRRIISMLISGLRSMLGPLAGAAHDVMNVVHEFLPFSPAKRGPLSGGGSPDRSGMRIAQMVAAGMAEGTPAVQAAASRMASAAGIGGHPALAGGTGGGTLQVQWVGGPSSGLDHALWEWMRQNVRFKGGGGPYSAQRALGDVWPR